MENNSNNLNQANTPVVNYNAADDEIDLRELFTAIWQGKWIIINYFAEWCAPCLREIPELNDFKALTDGKQNAVLFGVSYDAMQDHELSLLAKKYNIEFPLINNVKTALPFETPKYLPATYLIRPDGTLEGQLLGEQNSKSLNQAIAND